MTGSLGGVRTLAATLALGLAAASSSGSVAGQAPPDSAQVPDSVALADSLLVTEDSVSADTIFYNLPRPALEVPDGFATGMWSWDRQAIMASGANTLGELLRDVPGVVMLLGGDYGTPLAMSAFGRGGAAYRVIRDGFEVYAVDGGVADLQHVGLAGIHRVRLDRSMGQMVVELWSHEHDDGRPFSIIEAGTGDLDTNMFRGVYADPTALLGSIAVGLERVDTRGSGVRRTEGGNRTGSWARYQYHFGDAAGIALDYRRVGSQTQVDQYAPRGTRTDLVLQASWRPAAGVVVQGMTGRSSLEREPLADEQWTRVGGSRRQHALRVGFERGAGWLQGGVRLFEGDLPSRSVRGSAGLASLRWGGAEARWESGSWSGTSASNLGARAWFRPLRPFTLFAQYEAGDFAGRARPVSDGPPPPPLPDDDANGAPVITDRTGFRVGGAVDLFGVRLGGAALYGHADQVTPLGVELDAGAPSTPGVHRNGYEATGVLPMPLEGLTLQGSYQWWDEGGPYLPRQIYRGSFEFHRLYLETGNLELWGSLGVRGHDPMLTFAPEGLEGGPGIVGVPFFQVWYAHVQVRVVTVRLWLGMENMTFRRNLQSYPGRVLPAARTFFALRWDMWN